MSSERGEVLLSSIHINLQERSITFEAADQPVAKITLSPEGIIFEPQPSPSLPSKEAEKLTPNRSGSGEKEPTVTLTGRLKSKPKEGRSDSKGNPTAWAKFAAHEEEREQAHLYLATFHRHTAKIALSLGKDSQITIEGYPHLSQASSGKRMDTLSVINIPSFPGKQEKQ